jgi:hypothetical protein
MQESPGYHGLTSLERSGVKLLWDRFDDL